MTTTMWVRRLGIASAMLVATAACGQTSDVANPSPPAPVETAESHRAPSRDHKGPRSAPEKDPFAAPAPDKEPVAAAPAPDPAPLPPPPRPPARKKDHGQWSYPPLSLVVSYVEGTVYVGAQAWARDGCHSIVGSTRGNHIRIKGEYGSYSGNYACTMALHADWYAVPAPYGKSSVRVTYAGHAGRYRIHVSRDGIKTRYQAGDNVAPPESEEWWWIPDDILLAHVWYGKPDAIKRVSDRVHERLLDEGATTFEAPEGRPIPVESSPEYAPGSGGSGFRDEYVDDLRPNTRTRVYLSGLSWDELRDIAHEEAQTERCTYVRFSRDPYRNGVIGRPPCDRD